MLPELLSLLPVAIVGAVLGLDVVSFPQAMISRPIVAATLGGALAGDITSGLVAGAVLEMIALEMLPVGASRYPEWGTASVVGGAMAAEFYTLPGAAVVAIFASIATAWAGGWSMYGLRRLNGIWVRRELGMLEAGHPGTVTGLQLRGLTADIARGFLLTLIALLLWLPLASWVLSHWTLGRTPSHVVLAAVAAAVAGSAAWRISQGVRLARWCFLGGLVAGIAILVLRR
ncbi:MAG TPA: PTS sugar transporter subunit IIC [Gemmatimonadaceae bacterium]|jgi:Phosphotransferase system, mannose/fructose/N-acetylgalactosamine-specific component IIC